MKQEPKERTFSDYIALLLIVILFVFVEVTAFFLGYTHKHNYKCEGEREIIKETTVNLDRDTTQLPVGMKYYVMCKNTGVIKTYRGF